MTSRDGPGPGPAALARESAPRRPARRGVLAAAAAALPLLAAGCKGIGALGTPPQPLPDVAVLQDAIASERLLIARYEDVFSRVPALTGPLRPLLSQHRAHLGRLRARLAGPRPTASPAPSPAGAPQSTRAAVAYLRGAEQGAAATLLGHLAAVPPSLAQLLASIAASEATHAAALATLERAG